MRIFWHMPTLRRHCCGLSLRAVRLAAGLRQRNHAVTFFVNADKTDLDGDQVEGLPIHRLNVERRPPRHWCLQATRRMQTARRLARQMGSGCDVIISCQPEVVTACAAAGCRPPVVFVCGSSTLLHDAAELRDQASLSAVKRLPFAVDRRLKRYHERRAFQAADLVIFDSVQTRDRVFAEYRIRPRQGRTIYGGVDATAYQPVDAAVRRLTRRALGIHDDGHVVVWTGRCSPEKNVELLIQSVPLCRHRPARVLLIGDGPQRNALAGLSRELGLQDIVQFCGEHDDVRPFLHAADVFAFPSRGESFGGSLVEALACGLPAVGLRPDDRIIRNANCEIIEHGHCGLLVDEPRPAAFAAAMDRLAEDQELRRRLGVAARQWVIRSFTWDRAARQLEQALWALVEGRGSAPTPEANVEAFCANCVA
jgi:glycosyltransferase involved in cell wall biosynthesis